jgi:hypothetical protein
MEGRPIRLMCGAGRNTHGIDQTSKMTLLWLGCVIVTLAGSGRPRPGSMR